MPRRGASGVFGAGRRAGVMFCSVAVVLLCGTLAARGAHFEVRVAPHAPFAFIDGDGTWVGYDVDFLELLFKLLREQNSMDTELSDASYEFVEMATVVEATNISSALAPGSNDTSSLAVMVAGGLSVTSERVNKMTMTRPYYNAGLGILAKQFERPVMLWVLFEPFRVEVWFLVVFFIYVSAHIIWCFEHQYQPAQFPRAYVKGINESVWYCWGISVGTGKRDLVGLPARMYSIGWSLIALMIIATYTAALAATLTVASFDVGIQGASDLPNKAVASVLGTTGEDYIRKFLPNAYFHGFATPFEAIRSLQNETVDAVIFDAPGLLYYNGLLNSFQSGLYVADELLSEEVYAFGLPHGSVYVEAFDVAISTIFEQNREYPIYNEWLNRATVERRDTSELHVELSPGNAAGVFIILGGSISAAAALWIFTFSKKYL